MVGTQVSTQQLFVEVLGHVVEAPVHHAPPVTQHVPHGKRGLVDDILCWPRPS